MKTFINLKLLRTQQGQALSEFLLVLPICLLMMGGLGLIFERSLWYFYGDHLLYEGLICTNTHSRNICEQKIKQNIKVFNIFKRSFDLDIRTGTREVSGTLKVKIPVELSISKNFRTYQ